MIDPKAYPIKLGRQPLENMMDHIDLLMLAHVSVYLYNMHIHMSSDQFHVHSSMHTYYSIRSTYQCTSYVLRTPYPVHMYVRTSAVGKGKELELTHLHPSHALFHSQPKRGLYHRWTTVQYQARYPAKRRRPPDPSTSKKTRPIGNRRGCNADAESSSY